MSLFPSARVWPFWSGRLLWTVFEMQVLALPRVLAILLKPLGRPSSVPRCLRAPLIVSTGVDLGTGLAVAVVLGERGRVMSAS